MKYLGMGLLLLVIFLAVRGYRARLERSADTAEAFLELIGHIYVRVSQYTESPGAWGGGFGTDNPSVGEFLSRLREGVTPSVAFAALGEEVGLSAEARERLGSLFNSLLGDDVEREKRLIAEAERDMREIVDKERHAVGENGRVAVIVAFLISAGGVILII